MSLFYFLLLKRYESRKGVVVSSSQITSISSVQQGQIDGGWTWGKFLIYVEYIYVQCVLNFTMFFFIVCLYLGSWKDNISELHSRDTHPTKHFNCWNFYSTICVTFERILFILSLPNFSARWDCVQCMGFSWSTGLLWHTSMFFDRESSLSCSVQCHTWKRRC